MRRHRPADDEELFPPIIEQIGLPGLRAAVRRVTCPGCAQPAEVDADGPELCRLCAERPAATRERIAIVWAGAQARRAMAERRHESEGGAAALADLRSVIALTAPILARCARAEAALNIVAPLCANPESTTR